MKVRELIEHLQQFDPELVVWHSDGGYCEGAARTIEPIKILADVAGLDGDEVDDEYFYYDPEDEDNVESYASIVLNPEQYGYLPVDNGNIYSKYIVLLKSTLDK